MKRTIACMLALALLTCALPAGAQGPYDALYLLVSRDAAQVDTPIGSAVVFLENNTLLTTVYALQAEGELYAISSGGEFLIENGALPGESSELAILTMAEASPATPLDLSSMETGSLTSVGLTWDGHLVADSAGYVSVGTYGEEISLMYTSQAGMMPGSVLLDDSGQLAAMMVAAYGEGAGRYVAITAESIYTQLTGETAPYDVQANLPEGASWVEGFTLSFENGLLVADWSACDVADDREDCVFEVFFMNPDNPYYSYGEAVKGETRLEMAAAPGNTYQVWVQHAHGEATVEDYQPETVVTIDVPEAERFTRYAYWDQDMYLAALGQGMIPEATDLLPPVENITVQALSEPDAVFCLQAVSTYKVDEQLEANLAIVLETPEGFSFVQMGGFIFDPAIGQKDVWHSDITELFTDYRTLNGTGEYAPGQYRLCYYLDGLLANEMTFVLE